MQSPADLARSSLPSGTADRHRRPLSWIAVVAAFVSLFALLPLGFVIWVTVQTGWETVAALVFRPRVGELLVNTVLLVLLTVPISIVLAVALAWLTERSDLPGARLWSWLAVAPLAVPAFVHSYAWISLVPEAARPVGRRAGFGARLFPVSLSAGRGGPAPARSRPSRMRRPRSASRPGACSCASCCRSCGWPSAAAPAGRPASPGRIRPLRDDPLRHLHHRDRRSVPVDLQRPGRQHAGRRAGRLLLRAARAGGAGSAARSAMRASAPAPRAGSSAAGSAAPRSSAWLCRSLTTLLALGVPFVTLARWLVAGGARGLASRRDRPGARPDAVPGACRRAAGHRRRHADGLALDPRAGPRCSALLEACNYIVGSLPGVVVALALVTITVRVALPLYQTTGHASWSPMC